jgi:hypothetical protein
MHLSGSCLSLCLSLCLVLGPGPAQAQTVYKWVDSHGVTQYSSSPPPPGVATSVLRPPPVPDAASAVPGTAQRPTDDAKRLATERAQQDAAQRAAAQRDSSTRLAQCANAREQLDAVSRGGPVFRYNAAGQREYLDDSARDSEIARWQQQVNTLCGPGAGSPAAQDEATRQQSEAAQRGAQCRAAQEALRELQTGASRTVDADLAQAADRVRRLCGGAP